MCWWEGLVASVGIALKVISRIKTGSEGAVFTFRLVDRCFPLCHADMHTKTDKI